MLHECFGPCDLLPSDAAVVLIYYFVCFSPIRSISVLNPALLLEDDLGSDVLPLACSVSSVVELFSLAYSPDLTLLGIPSWLVVLDSWVLLSGLRYS